MFDTKPKVRGLALIDCGALLALGALAPPAKAAEETRFRFVADEVDPETARAACEDALRERPGAADLLFSLGLAAFRLGDLDASVLHWREAAEQGHPPAMGALGDVYAQGLGVPQDDREAYVWTRRAAELGDAPAQNQLGRLYMLGVGTAQDEAESVVWFRRSAGPIRLRSGKAARRSGTRWVTRWRSRLTNAMCRVLQPSIII